MPKRPRIVPLPTPATLAQSAVMYLQRFAASEEKLRRVLHQRVMRAKFSHKDFAEDTARQAVLLEAIENIIDRHKKTGTINDQDYAAMKVSSLRRAGRSKKFITQKLGQGGLQPTYIQQALREHDGEGPESNDEAELKAATAFARKKRLGGFRTHMIKADDMRHNKDVAAMARAGFGFALIKRVLKIDSDIDFGEPD